VWTAQEILLARRATIVSGPCQISWDSFCTAVEHANTFGAFKVVVLGVVPRSSAWMVDNIRSLQRAPRLPNPADELLFYLLRTRARDATDARDKIFAVLGLVSGNTLDLGIQPDYGASVEDVYCEATRRLIVVSGNLEVLGLCYPFDDGRATNLLSWVPDWSSRGYLASPLMEDAHGNRRQTHASRNTATEPTWEDNGMTLVVEGHVVDAVAAVSVVQHRYDDDAVWDMSAWEAAGDSVPWYKDLRDAFFILGKGLGDLPSMVSGHVASYIAWEEFVEKAQPTNPGSDNCDPMQIYCSTLCAGTLASPGHPETETLFKVWFDQLDPIRQLKAWSLDKLKACLIS
jgi:hypothetical protein